MKNIKRLTLINIILISSLYFFGGMTREAAFILLLPNVLFLISYWEKA